MKIECGSKAPRVRKINFPCLLLGSRGRKYSGLSNAEVCKMYFNLFTENFFDGVELSWYNNVKSHRKGHIDGVIPERKSSFLTIHTLFEFHQVLLKYVPAIKSIYLAKNDVLEEPENMDQKVKQIVETL